MTCNDVRQHWMLYLDSEGDPGLHFRIGDHLAMCPECAAWFAKQQRFESALNERLAAGKPTPELWQRLSRRIRPGASRRRWLVASAALAAAAILLAVGSVLLLPGRSESSELAQIAADWHEKLLHGKVQPNKISTSDKEVDDYLKANAPFPVHCPPRTDVNFAVQGAGLCMLKDQQQAAYIVGQVDQSPVFILVLDKASLAAFPREGAHLRGGRRYRCREGDYQMVSGIIADNVVVVIGAAPAQALEKLLNAYGTYHEG